MNAQTQERIASAVVIVTGLWVAFSPLMLDMSQSAGWNAILAGSALALLGVGQLFFRSAVPSVLGIFLSFWLLMAAFIFEQSVAAMWSLVIAGVVGVVSASWDTVAALDNDVGITMHPAA